VRGCDIEDPVDHRAVALCKMERGQIAGGVLDAPLGWPSAQGKGEGVREAR
jgi:hypothetical protein